MNRLKLISINLLLLFIAAGLSSCEAIAGIFKAGMWTGILVVVGIVGLIIFFVGKSRK